MAAATATVQRSFDLDDVNEHGVKASTEIFQGTCVRADATGFALGGTVFAEATDSLLGFALEGKDNLTGANGAVTVKVRHAGAIELAVTGAVVTSIGAEVFATDDSTFTMTASTNMKIGTVHRFVSSGVAIVKFDASVRKL